jgi:redox-sensitive bicupin YhaK (pirin superfamily)
MPITAKLPGHVKDLGGGFMIRRFLPSIERRAVGPFVFMDHFGPVTQQPGDSFDVRPHPHIGLATVTYLFEGAMMHRDSLGSVQRIEPGAVNWMTAGRGIVHSERTPDDVREATRSMHGLQLWVGLPQAHEEAEPAFIHTPSDRIPSIMIGDITVRILIGEAFGVASPVATLSPTLYLDVEAPRGGTLTLPAEGLERSIYALSPLAIDGDVVEPRQLALLEPSREATVSIGPEGGRFVVLGGEPLDGERHIWWNFVSSSRARIETAKRDWKEQRFAGVPGETEFIPLPDR